MGSELNFEIPGLEWLYIHFHIGERIFVEDWANAIQSKSNPGHVPVLFYRTRSDPWIVVMKVGLPVPGGSDYFSWAPINMADFRRYVEIRMIRELSEPAALLADVIGIENIP